ncbi:haloacid dehalogenase-like hydrolase [uncultured Herbaspirillum sp.]|uniref:haloacid dehalogenase-like hydrolase n=1 Tax=uncultured Herbaspirillum sp. TaxID=160236 RepID=UPI002585B656|nr:haloacid dehalogenase-like hydrolase [uncultured Herbaspirillum sp.]
MRIGLDFDNTIVTYDSLFHKVASEQGLVPASLPVSKVAVRDYLREAGNDAAFTEMQGYVYGARMGEAQAYPGVFEFIRHAHAQGAELLIVSHKTRHPFKGPQYDLHAAATGWIDATLRTATGSDALQAVYFEPTKEAKIARIAECQCDYFIDDLPEILRLPGFPPQTTRLLFDPENNHAAAPDLTRLSAWAEIQAFFEGRW